MTNANDPVFPCSHLDVEDENRDRIIRKYQVCLTKRELFAALAMQGFVANSKNHLAFHPKDDAEYCIKLADALIAEPSQFCDGETNKLAVHFDVVNIVRELLAARKVIEAAREVDVFDDAALERALEAYDALGVKS